jgi:hypothetical protein
MTLMKEYVEKVEIINKIINVNKIRITKYFFK